MLYFTASKEIGTGLAMVIFFSYPVFVALTGWAARNIELNIFSIGSLLAIGIGMYLLRGHGASTLSVVGILFAIGAALSYAMYILGSKTQAEVLSSDVLTILVCFGNMLFFLFLSLGSHSLTAPTHLSGWIHVIALGIFATALPIQLLLDGLRYISSLKASILSVLEPVVTLVVGAELLGETMSHMQIVGIFIILAGAILIQFER